MAQKGFIFKPFPIRCSPQPIELISLDPIKSPCADPSPPDCRWNRMQKIFKTKTSHLFALSGFAVAQPLFDILGVPLFMKLPGQKKGAVRNEAIQVIDILPTIADSLDIDVPWKLDGESPFKRKEESSTRPIISDTASTVEALKYPRDPQRKYKTLKKKYILFGSGSEDLLYKIGPKSELWG